MTKEERDAIWFDVVDMVEYITRDRDASHATITRSKGFVAWINLDTDGGDVSVSVEQESDELYQRLREALVEIRREDDDAKELSDYERCEMIESCISSGPYFRASFWG